LVPIPGSSQTLTSCTSLFSMDQKKAVPFVSKKKAPIIGAFWLMVGQTSIAS
jgi:hypothetical protein